MMRKSKIILLLLWLSSGSVVRAEEPIAPVEVTFTAQLDGTAQKYVLVPPRAFDPSKTYSLMIALHGHGSDRWQFVHSDRDECRAARSVASKYNLLFVCPDYRAKTSWMGPAAEADLLQILDEVHAQYRIDKTIVMGGSMGGSSALTFTALHPERVDGVVSLNGTANHLEYEQFQEFIAAAYGGTKAEIPVEYKRRSAEYWPERFTMPVAMTTGGTDALVPPDSCLRLAAILAKLNPHSLLIHRPEGGHATNLEDSTAALEFVCNRVFATGNESTVDGEQ